VTAGERVLVFSSRRRHTRVVSDWSSDVCSSDLYLPDRSIKPGSGNLHGPTGIIFDRRWNEVLVSNQNMYQPFAGEILRYDGSDRSEERRVGKEWRSRRSTDSSRKRCAA